MTALLEEAAWAVTAANVFRTAGWVDEATAHEEWAADRLSEHNATTPPEAPDTDVPADEDATWDEGGEG